MSVKAPLDVSSDAARFAVGAPALAAPTRLPRPRTRPERVGLLATTTIPLIGLLLCIAGPRTEALVAQTIQLAPPAALAGPFHYISFRMTGGEVAAALVMMLFAYLVVLRPSVHLSARSVIWAVAAFNVIVLLGPPLFSTDVFSYQAYARMLAVYHTNPYLNGPSAISLDHLYNYIGSDWIHVPSVYGPLFTFLSGAFASSSISISEFGFKAIAAAASGGTLYLIWRSAPLRGVDPVRAIALFGLNPLVTLYGVGGGHNDLLMVMLTSAGVYALLCRREALSGGLLAAGTAIKLTGGIMLPFAMASLGGPDGRREWRRLIGGVAAVSVVIAAASAPVFGTGILHLPSTLESVQNNGNKWQSVPGFLFQLAHVPVTAGVRIAFAVPLVATLLWLLRRVWNGRMDWIAGAAWATFALLVSAWYLLAWYVCWLIPLVALTRSARLWRATVAMTLIGSAIMIIGCFQSSTLIAS
jgi:hypothetical protein